MKLFCNTNIFITSFVEDSPFLEACRKTVVQQSIYLSHQIILEFIRACSSPRFNLFSVNQARSVIEKISLQKNTVTLFPEEKTLRIWLELQHKYPLNSNLVFDTYIVATMLTHGISKLVTLNTKDFAFFKEIEVFSPESVIA